MKVHVLRGEPSGNTYQIVVHAPAPTGNNASGFTWQAVIVASEKPSTVLSIGTGPGQTTQEEANDIAAGLVLEARFDFVDDPSISNATRNQLLDTLANSAIAAMQTRLQMMLKFYGATRP